MSEKNNHDDLIGRTLGPFEILEEVGRGGMATVYRARQTSMNRIVAMKVLPRHLLHDPSFYDRFTREVEVISHLEHPHILPIYDYGQSEGVPFIAMRFLGGGSLEDEIRRRGPLPLDDLEKPLRQIAQALDYAHGQGIIHRDLKPGNIMLDEGGNAYLSDFGIARVMGSEMTGSMIIGTPSYMSPEQANGFPIDARADVYSLGVVLFELITGRLPFQAETPMAVLLKHINEEVPPIADFRDDVSAVVEDVVRKATAKDPNDRFASAGDMAKTYGRALRDETAAFDKPTESRPATRPTPPSHLTEQPTMPPGVMHTPTPIPAPAVSTDSAIPEPRGSNRLLMGIVGLVVIGIAAVAAFFGLSSGGADNPVDINAVPTPFPRAQTYTGDQFTISVPSGWTEGQFNFSQATIGRSVNTWFEERNGELEAVIALTVIDADLKEGDQTFFEVAVADFVGEHYDRRLLQNALMLIDEAEAPNGSIRRSYRFTPPGDGSGITFGPRGITILPGQMDIFFIQQPPYLAVLEMYTADTVGSETSMIVRLQSVLDSLRIRPA